jgi:hypothetical protein
MHVNQCIRNKKNLLASADFFYFYILSVQNTIILIYYQSTS